MALKPVLAGHTVGFIAIFEFAAMIVSVVFFAMELWMPVQIVLVASAMRMKGIGMSGIFVACNTILGLDFAVEIFGVIPDWILSVFGVVAITIIVSHFNFPMPGTGGAQTETVVETPVAVQPAVTNAPGKFAE